MSRNLGSLSVDLILRNAGFEAGMDKSARAAEKSLKRIQSTARGIGTAFAALAGFVSFRAIIAASAEAAKNFAQLENAVKNAGAAAGGRTAAQFADVSEQLQHVTTFSDDAVQGVQQLLLRFQSIRTDRFDEATKSVLDLATAMGTDAEAAAKLLGRALTDPEKGMTALARAGVVFSDSQKKIIKDLVDTGQQAEAQGIILDELRKKFGGAAEAARNNFGGALAGLKNDFDNLLEVNGGLPGATEAVNDFAKVLQDPAIRQGVDTLFSAIITLAAQAAAGIAEMAGGLKILVGGTDDEVQELDKQIGELESQLKSLHEQNPFPDEFSKKQIEEKTAALAKLIDQQERLLGVGLGGAAAARENRGAGRPQGPAAFELPDIEVVGQTEEAAKAAEAALKSLESQAKALTEATATPLEKYQTSVAEADKLLAANLITLETWARAVGAARIELDAFNASAAETAPKSLEDLNSEFDKSLEGGLTTEQQNNLDDLIDQGTDSVLDDFEQTAGEAEKRLTVFAEQAARNTQDILADGLENALHNGIKNGAEGALAAFADMLEKMALQAIAAKIAQKIFGTEDGSSAGGTGGGWLGNIFGAVASAYGGSRAGGGPVSPGLRYRVNENTPRSEWFVPDTPGRIVPHEQMMGGTAVTNNFVIQAPQGSVDRRTQLQIAASVARGLGEANRRNN